MKKLNIKEFTIFLLISIFIFSSMSIYKVEASIKRVNRVGGNDRYQTAAMFAKANWDRTCENLILASGEGYADTLSSTVLSRKLDAPIVLTSSDSLNINARNIIETLKPKNIYIIGGEGSISSSIREELKRKNEYNLIELGGQDRFGTNVSIANYLVENLGLDANEVFVVNGSDGFSDALSVAPIAASKQRILLIASKNTENCNLASNFIRRNNSSVTVIGTEIVVPNSVYSVLRASNRINGGQDRFETNLNILRRFKNDLRNDKLYVANASNIISGYSDALVASTLAGKYKSPLILTDKVGRVGTGNAIEYIKENIVADGKAEAIGGEGVIPYTLINEIDAAIKNKLEIK